MDEEDIVDSFLDEVDTAFDDDDDEDDADEDVGDDAFFAVKSGDTGGGSLNEFTGRYSSDDAWLLCRMTFIIRIGLK